MAGFKEYTMMFQLSASTSAQFSSAFSGAQSQISQLQSRIESLNRQQGDIAAYTRQQAAVEKTRAKLEVLRQQYENLKKAQDQAGGSNVDLQNKMLDKQLQIDKTSAALEQQTGKLDAMGNALNEAGIDTGNLAAESSRLEAELGGLRSEQEAVAESAEASANGFQASAEAMQQMLVAAGVVDLLKNIGGALKECADASIQYESAMAGVRRTVGGGDSFISGLGDDFKYLSTVIPITATDLAGIATTAGQLGIAQDYVGEFAEVMAKLATTTDLSSEDASTMLAQFANITGTTDYQRLGSAVASLGDATATTASKVVQMSQGMAASATQAGMSETDILGISAAVGSLGIEAQAGSTAMSTLISTLYKAVETGDGLEDFASVANMTASEFKTAWQEDAAGALDSFINGLNDVERNGRSAIVILDELGINNVRQTKAILGLASANGLMTRTIDQANQAWQQNTALDEKASIMYETTEAKMAMMENAFTNVKIAVGDALTPAMGSLAEAATAILQPVSEFIAANPALVQGLVTVVGVIAGATAALIALSAGMKVVAAAGALMTAAIPGLPVILGITAGVAALAGGLVFLHQSLSDAGESFEELDAGYDAMIANIAGQQHILDLADEYRDLQGALGGLGDTEVNEIELTATAAADLVSTDFMSPDDPGIELTAGQVADRLQSGFMAEEDEGITLTAQQTANLVAEGFLDPGDEGIELTAEQEATLTALGFLVDEDGTVHLSGEAEGDLEAADFMSAEDPGITLTAEQTADLLAAGFLSADDKGITLEADAEASLTGGDFVEDATVEITPELGDLDAINAQIAALSSEIAAVGGDLTAAKTALGEMQASYDELGLKLLATNEKGEKEGYAAQMETLSEAIAAQKGEVDALQGKYDGLNSELSAAQGAASELAAKEARLAEVKQELIEASGGIISASADETEAFEQQLAVVEALARVRMDEARSTAYDSITKQSRAYAQAARDADMNAELLAATNAEYDRAAATFAETFGGGVEGIVNEMNTLRDAVLDTADDSGYIDFGADEVRAKLDEMEQLYFAATGVREKIDDRWSFEHVANTVGQAVDAEGSSQALAELAAQAQGYAEALGEADDVQTTFLDNLVAGVRGGGMSMETLRQLLEQQFEGMADGAELVDDAMAYVTAHLDSAADASGDFADGVDEAAASALELQNAVSPIIEQMDELSKAYEEAYDSALSSIDGQFKLFEKVGPIEISTQFVNTGDDSMREGLESQAQYMEEYVAMLEKARDIGVNTDLLSELADGSAESAETLKRLVSDSTTPEDIEALNASYELVQQKKEEFASTVADIQTDFSDTMTELQSQMATTVGEMEMSSEAATNARSTFQAMIDQANSMLPLVQAAYSRVAQAAQAALKVSPVAGGRGGISAYAVGTTHAAEGYALVGEHGPELVYFGGGEEVYTADQTAAMLRDFSAMQAAPMEAESYAAFANDPAPQLVFSPTYNISGAANADELREILREHDEELRAEFEEMLSETEADRSRRALV